MKALVILLSLVQVSLPCDFSKVRTSVYPFTADYSNSLFLDPISPGYLGEKIKGQWTYALLRKHWRIEPSQVMQYSLMRR